MEGIQVITPDFVNVHITKSDSEDAAVERRFKKGITVLDFKTKLELVTGGSAATMKLKLFDNKNNFVCDINNDSALLGSYPIDDGMRIHVIDKFTLVREFTSSESQERMNAAARKRKCREKLKSDPEKWHLRREEKRDKVRRQKKTVTLLAHKGKLDERFRLSEEEYEKKGDTLRSFLQRNRLGKYNDEEMQKLKEEQEKELAEEVKLAESVTVGSRCEVRVPQQAVRRATVRYNGPLDGAKGLWIGVQYDEPRGKNDGEVNGKRYFTCPPKYGGFVKPVYVTVGDFPEEEFDLDDEI